MTEHRIISIEELKLRAAGIPVEIPDWDGRNKIWVKVRNIDITSKLMSTGLMIPNLLKASVIEAFEGKEDPKSKKKGAVDEDKFSGELIKMMPLLDEVCADALVEPSIESLKEIGLELTLAQKTAIFKIVTGDAEGLGKFRL